VQPPLPDHRHPAGAFPGPCPVPYFATPIPESLRQRRILLLSYHFPPSPAAGALRWQKFAALFAEQDWGVDVVALDPAQLSRQEPDRYRELPAGTRVFGVREAELFIEKLERQAWRAYRRVRDLRGMSRESGPQVASGAPSRPAPTLRRDELRWQLWHPVGWRRAYYAWVRFARERAWARRAASVARAVAAPGIHRVVISCGPPHLVHEAGRSVAETTGLPLVVDMRDPWSLEHRFQEYAASPLQVRLAARAERRILDRAALLVMNTPTAAEMMAVAYPRTRVLSILNGYDEETMPSIPPRERFIVAYAGSIYLDRDPRLVFRAAARVVRELELTPGQFGFEFIGSAGSYGGSSVEEIAAEEGLGGYVRTGPERPRAEAMAFLAQASVLLSLPQETAFAIPSKIYEYMRFPAWLLALTERESATDLVLADSGADVVRPTDVEGMVSVLRRRYSAFAAGERPSPVAQDPRLSRRYQAGLLLDAIAEISPLQARIP
jgi:glycosyltransferase involved in cell wall biosynthesis